MTAPSVPIDVDPATGVWTTDGLPMIYLPRHFFINLVEAVEGALSREGARQHFYDAGYRAAHAWCGHEANAQRLSGIAVFHHYMRRLSQRGWGRFDGSAIDPRTGLGRVTLRHSCFALHYGSKAGRRVCYLCEGWFPGALDWVGGPLGWPKLTARETACVGEGAPECRFEVSAA